MGTPTFSETSMDWVGAGGTSEAPPVADALDETIPLPLSPGNISPLFHNARFFFLNKL
jgi:hypothetical protein